MIRFFIMYLFSLFTLFVGMAIVIKPVAVYDFIHSYSKSLTIHILAVHRLVAFFSMVWFNLRARSVEMDCWVFQSKS
jgi:hypothetical protein